MKYPIFGVALLLSGCWGYSERGDTVVGQVKTISKNTPLFFCPDFVEVDLSLGVMRHGVGSMSVKDIWLLVKDPRDIEPLTEAARTGAIVELTVDTKRFALCTHNDEITAVKVEQVETDLE